MRRYYLSNATRSHSGVTAINEFALIRDPDSGDTTSRSVAALGDEVSFSWITEGGEPNAYEWANAELRAQLDVTAAGANLSYGFTDVVLLGVYGGFTRTDSGDTEQVVQFQDEATFTGTGLKLASTFWIGEATARTDKYALLLNVRNTGLGAQTITLRFGANAWTDGPWLSKQAYSPLALMGVGI